MTRIAESTSGSAPPLSSSGDRPPIPDQTGGASDNTNGANGCNDGAVQGRTHDSAGNGGQSATEKENEFVLPDIPDILVRFPLVM